MRTLKKLCTHLQLTLVSLVGGGQPVVLPRCPLGLVLCQPQPRTAVWHTATMHHPHPGSSVGAVDPSDLHQHTQKVVLQLFPTVCNPWCFGQFAIFRVIQIKAYGVLSFLLYFIRCNIVIIDMFHYFKKIYL